MVQIVKEKIRQITSKQAAAINQIIQSRDFNLAEYKKLKKILDSRVPNRTDASVFLEYCFAKVHFERHFNGRHHKAYAYCYFCKDRNDLRKIETLKTGIRRWCCGTCRINITDEDIVDVHTARQRRNEEIDADFIRAEVNGTDVKGVM